MERTDEALLDAARAGDRGALEALIARHQDRVYRFGRRLCRDPGDAEDVVQDTLLALARSVRDFQGRSSLSTWLFTVARSFCLKKRRKRKHAPDREASLEQEVAPESGALSDPGRSPDEIVAGKEVEVALDRAIRALDPDLREVLVLRDVEGLHAAEVAEVLGLSVAATKSRLHRARLRVRALVAPALGLGAEGELAPGEAAPGEAAPGKACPDILRMYSKHLEDEVSAALCARMERHVAGCTRCRAACDSLKRTLSLCRAAPSTPIPASLQASVREALRELVSS